MYGCDHLYFGNKVQSADQFTGPYVLRTDGKKELIQAQLLTRVGQEVNVSWLANHNTGRNSNPPQTQMSIQGELEGLVNNEVNHLVCLFQRSSPIRQYSLVCELVGLIR